MPLKWLVIKTENIEKIPKIQKTLRIKIIFKNLENFLNLWKIKENICLKMFQKVLLMINPLKLTLEAN